MSADFSRVRSNPLLNYAGVELKQGAVLLDADANELVAILDRRLRALASDVLGRATVGANTPEAFHITVETDPDGTRTLLIGPGRLYVDGLLAENHGLAPKETPVFDPLMGEACFSKPVPYGQQLYLLDAPDLPADGRHIVYLDVWNRELTHVEQPDLVESAVGVETSSRLQTIWQVKVMDKRVGNDVTCGTPDGQISDWAKLIAPSTGRLTTGTYDVSEVTDPCELPPTGGYRGLENQLYRVEIHGEGGLGEATFKWSRENASVAMRVVSSGSGTELELDSLGRDEVLGLKDDDWVEIIDDVYEFARKPGEMRRIKVIDEKPRHISLHAPISDEMRGAGFAGRNLRVRLWNQSRLISKTTGGGATAKYDDLDETPLDGLITVPKNGETLILENGVTVTFSNVGESGFRTGDYWVFAARTADASVEKLQQAPPRGVHHHYARLAIWDAGSPNTITDCRHFWPPAGGDDCACTQCVTAVEHNEGKFTIKDAIERVQKTGGTVCLGPGRYIVEAPIHVTGARSVRIKGQGPATVLVADIGAFWLESCMGVAIENLSIITAGDKGAALSVRSGLGIALSELIVLLPNAQTKVAALSLSGLVAGFSLRDSLIAGPIGIRALDPSVSNQSTFLITAALRIEDNVFSCAKQAIDFSGLAGHMLGTQISRNEVLACRGTAIKLAGAALSNAAVRVTDNCLSVIGPGIFCAVDGAWICDNKITRNTGDAIDKPLAGIVLSKAIDSNGSDQCQVLANQIAGFTDAGIYVDAPVRDLICKLNIIEKCGNGIVITGGGGTASIENNHLRDIGSARGAAQAALIDGIRLTNLESATVAGNTLRAIGTEAVAGLSRVSGIVSLGVRSVRITGNDIAEVGPSTPVNVSIVGGVLVYAPYDSSEVSGNHISRDAPGASAAADTMAWSAVFVDQPSPARPIVHAGDFTVATFANARMLVLAGTHALATSEVLDYFETAAPVTRLSSVTVRGNTLRARGARQVVSVEAGAHVQFSDNRCELTGGPGVAVTITAPAAVVSANVVMSNKDAIRIGSESVRATVIGNVTKGFIYLGPNTLANTPWEPLNVRI